MEKKLVELVLDDIALDASGQQAVLLLNIKGTNDYIQIWISPISAVSISKGVVESAPSRPSTHDLLKSVIVSLGATVDRVVISGWNVEQGLFFAKVILECDGETIELDARPSDAIALAVRMNAQIYAHQEIAEEVMVCLDEEGIGEKPKKFGKEDLDSGIRDFIESIKSLKEIGEDDPSQK